MDEREAKELGLGATGRYPAGKLNEDDQGELRAAIGVEGDKLTIHFGKPVTWLALTPEQALGLARVLTTNAARMIAGQPPEGG